MSDLRTAAQQALEALEAYLSDELRPYEAAKTADALRAALAQANAGNPITDYWFEHYVKRGLCSLCGNYGVIDTRGTRTPAGVAVGALHFCICPNGQKRREAGRALAQEPEPVQEPACSCSLRGRLVGDGCEVCNPELAAELRQQPEPVQEPVAWMWKERVNGDFDSAWRVTRCEPPPYAIEQQPLYTAPTPRKPETEQEPVESALQAVAEKIGDQCAVWYGIGARDVEEVLREAARHGLVHGALAESETTCRRAICQRGPDGYCAPCHERMYP